MTRCRDNGGASSNCLSNNTDDVGGAVSADDFLKLVRALIGCGASPDVAAQSAATLYASRSRSEPASSVLSGKSSARAERSKRRQETWQAKMSVLPYHSGQCYLHVVRWGRRAVYASELKASPTLRAFVAKLRRGDLDEAVAKEMYLYRVSPDTACGSNIAYHVAGECSDGVLISSVYDAVAGFQRLYPWVNTEYVLDGPGVESISLVGSVGGPVVSVDVSEEFVVSGDVVVEGGEVLECAVLSDAEASSDDETLVAESVSGDAQQFGDGVGGGESGGLVDRYFPLSIAEQILCSGHDWISVTESGVAAASSGTLYKVPIGVIARLSNGTVVNSYVRNTAMLLSSAVSVIEVSPLGSLLSQVLGWATYTSLNRCIVGEYSSGGVVVQCCRATLDEQFGSARCRFGNGSMEVRVSDVQRYWGGFGVGRRDSLVVQAELGSVRIGPVILVTGQHVLCAARSGVVDVAIVPLGDGALVLLEGSVVRDRA